MFIKLLGQPRDVVRCQTCIDKQYTRIPLSQKRKLEREREREMRCMRCARKRAPQVQQLVLWGKRDILLCYNQFVSQTVIILDVPAHTHIHTILALYPKLSSSLILYTSLSLSLCYSPLGIYYTYAFSLSYNAFGTHQCCYYSLQKLGGLDILLCCTFWLSLFKKSLAIFLLGLF